MSVIYGYPERTHYRNPAPAGEAAYAGGSGQKAGALERAAPANASAAASLRGMLERVRAAGGSLSDAGLQDALDDMVLRGDITDGEADEIFDGLKQARESMPPGAVMRRLDGLTAAGVMSGKQRMAAEAALSGAGESLQELVEEGRLTQEQADAVLDCCQSAVKLRQARQAYGLMQSNPLTQAAGGRQYAILDAYGQSLTDGLTV